ncbi:MAG: radical SAM protein [Chloroflexota bacterium]
MQNQHPYFVDWVITDRCNLHCRHCRGMLHGGLSNRAARKLIDEIAGLKPAWLIVEGGEPLLREDVFDLLGLARARGLEVHLISNGLLLTPQIATTLGELGVRVMLSMDGACRTTYESIRQGADFDEAVQRARMCSERGLLEAINFTVLKKNYREIPGIMELAASMGTPKVTFIGLKPCHNYPEELLSPDEYTEAISLACEGAEATGVEFFFDEPFFWPVVKERGLMAHVPQEGTGIVVPSTTACAFGDYLFIEPNGDVRPCSFAQLVLGNVSDKPLGEIWRETVSSPFMQRIRDPQSRTGYCRSCSYVKECKGCRSRTFVLTGDWFASDPVCPLQVRVGAERS